jgi:hypothetical protein
MDVQEMRRVTDSFAPVMNGNLPEVGAFHEAVPAIARMVAFLKRTL